MSWNENDYLDYTERADAEDAEAFAAFEAAREAEEYGIACMLDHVAGHCSHAAAIEGGARYEAECAASFRLALPAPAPAIAEPIWIALKEWRRAMAPTPRYAAIAPGLYVRVGNGKKNRNRRAA